MGAPLDVASQRQRLSRLFSSIISPDRRFYWLAFVYGLATAVLALAVPFSVQVLISTVSNTALLRPVVVLAIVLFSLLLMYGLLYAVQSHLMDRFERRFFARLSQTAVLRSLHARVIETPGLNREELANRFFEVVTVQRNVPKLVLDGTSVLLQSLVGIVVVAAYNPVFIVFSAVLLLIAWMIWRGWVDDAVTTKLAASRAKFKTARWIAELGRVHGSFQSERTIRYAAQQTENLIAAYVGEHRGHFRFKLSQLCGYYGLYALASAGLLGVGGWLVIRNQLTLGQLVAAELIFAAVFTSLTRLPSLLDQYYELCAAVDKLGELLEAPQESKIQGEPLPAGPLGLHFDRVDTQWAGIGYQLDYALAAGAKIWVQDDDDDLRAAVLALVQRRHVADSGCLRIGSAHVDELDVHQLRDAVIVVDDAEPLEQSIADNLSLGDESITRSQMRDQLQALGLGHVLERLPEGLDTRLARTGYPLSPEDAIRLKIAIALLARPRVLIVTPVLDRLSQRQRQAVIDAVLAQPSLTFVLFTHRDDVQGLQGPETLGHPLDRRDGDAA
ncbi:putative ABC transport system ATP-binding protein [Hydrocarboniphaga daqingensis]|uniref:Putative ABC transport system ATP-binding protein n=1 Tax=Hydrocarboniphaga daqingensis TaxID=490188 RepID=A0A1M5RAX9_9GAMM|nr:hypothetical protein [Hydrocarboniphaga daqingensis]SHH23421.1 putative ABC transport system ATP-binding protein [Hydrocarboniphaga daqingensis]